MRHQSSFANSCVFSLFLAALSFFLQPQTAFSQPDCVTNALSGYKGGECIVHIDRKNVSSRPGIIVPRGTKVTIELDNTRWDETIQFNPVTAQNADQDILSALIKSILPSLSVLAASQTPAHSLADRAKTDPDVSLQDEILKQLTTAALKINNANTDLTCFETYKELVPTIKDMAHACSLTPLNGPLQANVPPSNPPAVDTFNPAKTALIKTLRDAATAPLPVDTETEVDADIAARLSLCKPKQSPDPDPASTASCYAALSPLQSAQDRYKQIVTALEKIQVALQTDVMTLEAWPGTAPTQRWSVTQQYNRTSNVTIVATEIVLGTPATLGTVSVTWQSQPFVLSTGILLSTLTNRAYAISQVVKNGVPQPDPSAPTKYLTQITESDVRPSIVFPMVYGSYRVGWLSRSNWENHCPNHCAFLFSGGMGANLTGKTAEFGFGPSAQIGGVLFTVAAHVGRESRLTNGYYVGEQLGSNPPSALTTENKWITHLAFSVSYVIPTP